MQDSLYRHFFLEPYQPLHRRYEALRAVFVDGQSQVEVAKRFGYTYNTLRRLVSDFRAQCRADQVPPFHDSAARSPSRSAPWRSHRPS